MPGKALGPRLYPGVFRRFPATTVAQTLPLSGLRDGHEAAAKGVLEPLPGICGSDPRSPVASSAKRPLAPWAFPWASGPLVKSPQAQGCGLSWTVMDRAAHRWLWPPRGDGAGPRQSVHL